MTCSHRKAKSSVTPCEALTRLHVTDVYVRGRNLNYTITISIIIVKVCSSPPFIISLFCMLCRLYELPYGVYGFSRVRLRQSSAVCKM
jgi:hypothetical protein